MSETPQRVVIIGAGQAGGQTAYSLRQGGFAGDITIIGDEPAGIGIREDESPVTKNTSRFLPHYFE